MAANGDGFRRALDQARREVGIPAGFDPSPEANLARRYEAAAERGLFRALRAIADHKRGKTVDFGLPAGLGPPINPPAPFVMLASPMPTPRLDPDSGSFGAGVQPGLDRTNRAFELLGEPPLFPDPPRPKRPDVSKLDRSRR